MSSIKNVHSDKDFESSFKKYKKYKMRQLRLQWIIIYQDEDNVHGVPTRAKLFTKINVQHAHASSICRRLTSIKCLQYSVTITA